MLQSFNYNSQSALSWLWLCLCLVVTASAQARQCNLSELARPLYEVESQIQSYQLENGLTLRLLPQEGQEVVSIASQFAVGSADEPKGQTGYAHLFEHLLFKGSKNAPLDSYAAQLKALGAKFNASTHFDYTNYYLTLPSQGLELALFLESDRFIQPELTPKTVANQLAAVKEEMALRIDNQAYVRQAMDFLLQQVTDTPYGHAIIGSKEDLDQATTAKLNQFHRRYYRPNNMQLSLVGEIPPQTTAWIQQYFGNWQVHNSLAKDTAPFKLDTKSIHGEITDSRGPWPALLLAWHTVGQSHQDAAAVKLLESYLFQHPASLLQQVNLEQTDQLLHYSLPFTMNKHGITNLALVPRARASLNELAGQVDDLLQKAATESISPQMLCRLKNHWLTQHLSHLDRQQALAIHLSSTTEQDSRHPLTGEWLRINAVTEKDLQRVAQSYFIDQTVRLDMLPPWYIRWLKSISEWLPHSLIDSLEDKVL